MLTETNNQDNADTFGIKEIIFYEMAMLPRRKHE